MDWSEDLQQESMPNMPTSQISLRYMPYLHRAEPIRLQGLHRRGNKKFKKGSQKQDVTTPVGVGLVLHLKSVLLTACSVKLACMSCPDLPFQFFSMTRQEPRERKLT